MAKQFGDIMPKTMENFGALMGSVFEESDLDDKTIELITLAFGIAHQCDACIDFHMDKLVALGATENEIATVVGIAIVMGGGPGSAYGGKALAAYAAKSK